MSRVKSKNTVIEKILRKELIKNKYKFKKNCTEVFGTPDFILIDKKIAVFCDSEFWHGKNWKIQKYEHKSNRKFWWRKIELNIARDKKVNYTLKKQGWKVLRFWGKEIIKNKEKCIKKLEKLYRGIK